MKTSTSLISQITYKLEKKKKKKKKSLAYTSGLWGQYDPTLK